MVKMSEEQILVERFGRGPRHRKNDPEQMQKWVDSAFDRIVERYAADIAALANRLLGWPQDVDDVVQDVFERLAAFLSNRAYDNYDHLFQAGGKAWNQLTPERLCSICHTPMDTAHELIIIRIISQPW